MKRINAIISFVLASFTSSLFAYEYKKQGTWEDTVKEIKANTFQKGEKQGFEGFDSGLIDQKDKVIDFDIDIQGIRTISLQAIAPFGNGSAHAVWGNVYVIYKDGSKVPLTTLKPVSSKVGWDRLRVNKDPENRDLKIANRDVKNGFWAHANSEIIFKLKEGAVRLTGFCGLNRTTTNGKVVFLIKNKEKEEILSLLTKDFPIITTAFNNCDPSLLEKFVFENKDLELMKKNIGEKLGTASATAIEYNALVKSGIANEDKKGIVFITKAVEEYAEIQRAIKEVKNINLEALKLAIEDLEKDYGDKYKGEEYLQELKKYDGKIDEMLQYIAKPMIKETGEWISKNAKVEYSSLTEQFSTFKHKLMSGEEYPEVCAFHSVDNVRNPYVIVDLESAQTLESIIIENRTDGQQSRAKNLVVSVSNDKENWTDIWSNQGEALPVWKILVPTEKKSRYVKIWLNDNRAIFHLKSVKIFAPSSQELAITKEDLKYFDIITKIKSLAKLKRDALLSNPLLDFEQLVAVVRSSRCCPENWTGHSSIRRGAPWWNPDDALDVDAEIVTIDYKKIDAPMNVVYKPKARNYLGEVDLHFSGRKFLFARPKKSRTGNPVWHIYEYNLITNTLRQVTDDAITDYDCYDPCYLPNGKIIFNATLGYQGVPCNNGNDYVGNLCIMDADGKNLRRLTYDQENNWDPVVMNDGKIMYQRWEYTDSAHYFSRMLFDMYPDGREQRAVYGSNSYWPNTFFHARPIPDSDTKFVAIVSGHHVTPGEEGARREGELILFDTAQGRHEDSGVVQKIPGRGKKVVPVIKDEYMQGRWPRFAHPYPLSDKYFLVSAQFGKGKNWGLYLVDIFDNILLLKEIPGKFVYEPTPLKARATPPIIPDAVNFKSNEATVYISDIYIGPGLEGVKRGAVKELVVYAYEYSFRDTGNHDAVGIEGPWDIRKVIGTVPIYEDGSASFKIPANVPVAVLPLDANGNAMQLFRSWFVGVPGEIVSCVGCHENRDTPPPTRTTIAYSKTPAIPKPFYGPFRGFSFDREIQPILNKYCIGCHNTDAERHPHYENKAKPNFKSGRTSAKYYRFKNYVPWANHDWRENKSLSAPYLELMPYVRRNGPEGTWYVLTPLEFHFNTTQLGQMLAKGHHGVELDKKSWEKISMWVNMNLPMIGRWGEYKPQEVNDDKIKRIRELRAKYAGVQTTSEDLPVINPSKVEFVPPVNKDKPNAMPKLNNWPIKDPQSLQAKLGVIDSKIDLGDGIFVNLKKIPAGKFVMGDVKGTADENKVFVATIQKSFWIGETEISLKQFRQFRKEYKNGFYDRHWKDQVNPGYPMDENENYPAIRISYEEAESFCKWLSAKTGKKVRLPTEEEWEWTCRAGTNTEFSFGALTKDGVKFGKHANLADAMMREKAVGLRIDPIPHWPVKPTGYDKLPYAISPNIEGHVKDFEPYDTREYDGYLHLSPVGTFFANSWGVKDMHGNIAEWTSTPYKPYGKTRKSRTRMNKMTGNVVRGGSWYDRPYRATSAYRIAYPTWQRVFNVGFRIVVEE